MHRLLYGDFLHLVGQSGIINDFGMLEAATDRPVLRQEEEGVSSGTLVIPRLDLPLELFQEGKHEREGPLDKAESLDDLH